MAKDVVIAGPNPLTLRIIESLGLKGQCVKSLTITMSVDDLVCCASVVAMTKAQLEAVADYIADVTPVPRVSVMDVTGLTTPCAHQWARLYHRSRFTPSVALLLFVSLCALGLWAITR